MVERISNVPSQQEGTRTKISRRAIVAAAGAVSTAVLLVSCGSNEGAHGVQVESSPTAPAPVKVQHTTALKILRHSLPRLHILFHLRLPPTRNCTLKLLENVQLTARLLP